MFKLNIYNKFDYFQIKKAKISLIILTILKTPIS